MELYIVLAIMAFMIVGFVWEQMAIWPYCNDLLCAAGTDKCVSDR